MSAVVVVVGAGSIGQAIARRLSAGKRVVMADLHREKLSVANAAGASGAIIFNSAPAAGCPTVPRPGANNCEALVGMGAAAGAAALPIPAAFVQRSTGVALRDGTAVTATVQQ